MFRYKDVMMKDLKALTETLEKNSDPVITDLVGKVVGILGTATSLAIAGNREDLELLVIQAQEFAGQRGAVLQQQRLRVESEASGLFQRLQQPSH